MADLNKDQSLQIIEEMIENAKRDIREDAFYYLFSGYLVLASTVIHFSLMAFSTFSYPFIPWMVLMPLGGLVNFIYGYKQEKSKRVKTYIDTFMMYLWSGFLVSLIIGIFIFGHYGWITVFPFVILLYGLALFVSGSIIRFRPLIIGGVLNWLIAIVTVFVSFKVQFAMIGLAVITGYIIPGHLLQGRSKKEA